MIKIGTPKCFKINNKGNNVTVNYAYLDVSFDKEGWADAKVFMPEDFDLCYLKTKDSKIKTGWASGNHWDGLTIKPDDEILYWKTKRN